MGAKKVDGSLLADFEGSTVDIGREFTWLCHHTARRRLFCFYMAVFELSGFGNAAACARKAGFTQNKSEVQAAKLLARSDVLEEIASLKAQLRKRLIKTNIEKAFAKAVAAKAARAGFDVTRLYEFAEIETETGLQTVARIKPAEMLNEEERAMVEGLDFKGGVPCWKVASKTQAENELVALYLRLYADNGTGGYDVEATARAVDGTAVTLKATRRELAPDVFTAATNPSYED